MHAIHRLVITLGVCSIVSLVALSGTTAQATNNRSFKPQKTASLTEAIRDHNAHADGCRE
jgi:hypothetical protein